MVVPIALHLLQSLDLSLLMFQVPCLALAIHGFLLADEFEDSIQQWFHEHFLDESLLLFDRFFCNV